MLPSPAVQPGGAPVVGILEKETYPDGSVTWALTTKMPLRNTEGKTIGTFGISKDITALKKTEAETAARKADEARKVAETKAAAAKTAQAKAAQQAKKLEDVKKAAAAEAKRKAEEAARQAQAKKKADAEAAAKKLAESKKNRLARTALGAPYRPAAPRCPGSDRK